MSLVERIKKKCEEKGLNISNLEKKVGIGNGNIRRWDTQKTSYKNIVAVADALNVSTDWLLTGKESGELTTEERKLVDTFRNCNTTGQQDIQDYAEMIQNKKPAEISDSISTSNIG